MQTRHINHSATGQSRLAPGCTGFSLIELLTAISITTVIIFALYAMFSQTQKALHNNLTQVDVLESGRTTAEMLGRDLEQLTPSTVPQTINLYAGMEPIPPMVLLDADEVHVLRTNVLQEIFFLSRQTNSWVGTGYRVLGAQYGVGTLYRLVVSTNYYRLNATNLFGQFMYLTPTNPVTGQIRTNFTRIADGIVHLRLTAYDPDGRRMGWETTNMYPRYQLLRLTRSGGRLPLSTAADAVHANVSLQQDPFDPNETRLNFTSNAIPAYLELEIGVLEPTTYKRYVSMLPAPGFGGSPRAAQLFLSKQAGKVHLFRQRIPIRVAQP
jgi:prepilin-type N-terminal cleavage/methylation domain-containing protein